MFVRVHPRLASMTNAQTRFFQSIAHRFRNVEIIAPDSPIDSYALMDNCDLVLTYGSTMGVEALFANKPSILMGHAIYEDWGGVIKPSSHGDLIHMLKEFIARRRFAETGGYNLAIARYGYILQNVGIPLKHIAVKNTINGNATGFLRNGRLIIPRASAWDQMRVSPLQFVKQRFARALVRPILSALTDQGPQHPK
jgi:Capsule polysaccharide biosynthesis protein